MKPVIGSRVYNFGTMRINGVLPEEVLADKTVVVSSRQIFRRVKDMVDIYALSHCVDVQSHRIFDICEKKERKIDGFDAFLNQKDNLLIAYTKLKRVTGKPDFEVIYAYMEKFIEPFVKQDRANKIWVSESAPWQDA